MLPFCSLIYILWTSIYYWRRIQAMKYFDLSTELYENEIKALMFNCFIQSSSRYAKHLKVKIDLEKP